MLQRATFPFVGLFLCLSLLTACAWSRGTAGDDLRREAVETIKKGVTTRTEVVSKFGAPDRVIAANGRDVFQYFHYDVKASSLILIIVNFSRVAVKSDDLFVFFNKEGVVDDVVFSNRTEGMKFRHWPFSD
jgi:hypothetical protein